MRGKDEKLLDVFNSNGKRFIIPAYQRNYDWKQANCERLFDDLVLLTKSHRDGHFFGSLVTVENEDGFSTERLVIDGQQRVAGSKREIDEVKGAHAAYSKVEAFDPLSSRALLRAHALMTKNGHWEVIETRRKQ